jgi:putative spermidine/putrescine transport system permease protein
MSSYTQAGERRAALRRPTLAARTFRGLGPWVLVAPALILVLVFLVYPMIGIVLRSLDPEGALSYTSPQFSTANYSELINDEASRIILSNTLVVAGVAAAISVLIAYPVAAFLSRLPVKKARWLLLLALFPFWTSVLVRIYSLQLILNQVDLLFTQLAVIIGMVSYLLPLLILIFYSAMVRIDDNLLLAARTLGANSGRAFRRIFVPLSRPAVYSGTLLVFVIGLGFFLTPALLGGPGDITVSMYIQQRVIRGSWGLAATMGVCLLVAALIVYYVFDKFFGVEQIVDGGRGPVNVKVDEGGSNRQWASRNTKLALAGWSALVFAFLIVPLLCIVLLSFSSQSYLRLPPKGLSTNWYSEFFNEPGWRDAAWLSFRVALLTTVFATLMGLLAALGLTRGRMRGRRLLRALFMLPLIIPVILVAAGMYDIELRMKLAGDVLGYALAHTVLALPFTIIIISSALLQVGDSLEEAARSLGAGRVKSFVKVTLPLIMPSVVTAALIAFITSWEEVVVSLFLQVIQPTLPVAIYQFVQKDLRPTVTALSTLLIAGLLLIGLILFLVRRISARRRSSAAPPVAAASEMEVA